MRKTTEFNPDQPFTRPLIVAWTMGDLIAVLLKTAMGVSPKLRSLLLQFGRPRAWRSIKAHVYYGTSRTD